jgi:hypothetical protein
VPGLAAAPTPLTLGLLATNLKFSWWNATLESKTLFAEELTSGLATGIRIDANTLSVAVVAPYSGSETLSLISLNITVRSS